MCGCLWVGVDRHGDGAAAVCRAVLLNCKASACDVTAVGYLVLFCRRVLRAILREVDRRRLERKKKSEYCDSVVDGAA